MDVLCLNLSALNPHTPRVMWRVSVTLGASTTTTRDPRQGDRMLSTARRAGAKQTTEITRVNFLTYSEYQTTQRGRARPGDRQLERTVVATQSWVSALRSRTETTKAEK
jgi:hypothetical protein